MASKSFVRKQSPPSASPTNAHHDGEQLQSSTNHQGSAPAAGSWAAVAVPKNAAVALEQSSSVQPTSSSSSASSSPRLKQKKDEKNSQKQKIQNSKSQLPHSSSPTPPITPSSTLASSSHSNSNNAIAIEPLSSSSSSSSQSSLTSPSSSSPWWHGFAGGVPLGCQVRVNLKNSQEIVGLVLSFEDSLKILVLEVSPPSSSSSPASSLGSDYILLHFDSIRAISIMKTECVTIQFPPMKEEELKLKEQKAIEARREAASRIGVNVSVDAQRLFNAISKAYPCVWSNDSIIVADVVSISPPYTIEQVKPLNDGIQQENLLRFQKILERERQRLRMK